MSSAALLFLSGSMAGKGSKLKEDLIILGRSSSCDITVKDSSISREHVKFFKEDGIYILEDLNSNNGVKFEGEKIVRLELHTGMKFHIGKVEVQFIDPDQAPLIDAPIGGAVNIAPGGEYDISSENIDNDAENIAKVNALKVKRMTNIVVLCGIIAALGMLGVFLYQVLNKEDREVHVNSVKMYTKDQLVIDLAFEPLGSAESLLTPFVVNDYTEIELSFDTLRKGVDIVVEKNVKNPEISNAIKIKTKAATGGGSIIFYIREDDVRKKIGVLNIDVIRRPVPKIVTDYELASIDQKIKIAKDMLIDYKKNKNNSDKLKENWKLLRKAMAIFHGTLEGKPPVFFKLEGEYSALTKTIDRQTRNLFKKYAIALKAMNFNEMQNILWNVIDSNPDSENLYRQKAVIYIRRIDLLRK